MRVRYKEHSAELVNKCLTLYITDTFFEILFFMRLICSLRFKWQSMCTPRNLLESVLKMAGKKASKLPSRSTVNDWNIMRFIMAQQQLSEKLPQKENMALLSEETSKFGEKFEGFHTCDSAGRMYMLGLHDTKSEPNILSTFQQILCDIKDVSLQANTNSEISKKILLNITCNMSDRASTQIKFNDLLEEYQREILPDS